VLGDHELVGDLRRDAGGQRVRFVEPDLHVLEHAREGRPFDQARLVELGDERLEEFACQTASHLAHEVVEAPAAVHEREQGLRRGLRRDDLVRDLLGIGKAQHHQRLALGPLNGQGETPDLAELGVLLVLGRRVERWGDGLIGHAVPLVAC
jgi:hypothetical protein